MQVEDPMAAYGMPTINMDRNAVSSVKKTTSAADISNAPLLSEDIDIEDQPIV